MKRKNTASDEAVFPWDSGIEYKVWRAVIDEKFGLTANEIAERIEENVSSQRVGKICYRSPLIVPVSKGRKYGRRWRSLEKKEMKTFMKKFQSLLEKI